MMTKKLKQDLKRVKGDALIVCNTCGGDDIEEKIWVSANEYVQCPDGVYYKYINEAGDLFWCATCNEPCTPMPINDWKEKENESKI